MTREIDLKEAYPSVASEITKRISACQTALQKVLSEPKSNKAWIEADFITLQVRKICEMILLGSIFAHLWDGHNNLDLTKWHPKEMFQQLDGLNEFPLLIPIELELCTLGEQRQIMPTSKPLPFDIIASIYGRCNDLLHAPTASKVIKGKIQPFDTAKFQTWVDGFGRLMAGHVLMLPERNRILLCLWSGESGVKPDVYIMEAKGPSTFNVNMLPEFRILVV